MAVDVYVVLRQHNEYGDDVLRNVWLAAVRIFKEFNIEVYVIPLISNDRRKEVTLVINGFEIPVKNELSVDDAVDLILTYLPLRGRERLSYVVGAYVDEDRMLTDAAVI